MLFFLLAKITQLPSTNLIIRSLCKICQFFTALCTVFVIVIVEQIDCGQITYQNSFSMHVSLWFVTASVCDITVKEELPVGSG